MRKMTREAAWKAAWDAGDRAMRDAGRETWSAEDLLTAMEEFNRLWPVKLDSPMPCSEEDV